MIEQGVWGIYNGVEVYLFAIINSKGNKVQLTNYGAAIVAVVVPDKNGKRDNVVLGFPSLEGYLQDRCYIGTTIGRFANRIANGSFNIDGKRYFLETNENNNSNHSGENGFNTRVFNFEMDGNAVVFSLLSNDGDGGFPGNLKVTITYTWSDENELLIAYKAVTDKKTIVNLTNHSYFNLSAGKENILSHELSIASDRIVEVDEHYISTGNLIDAGSKKFHRQLIKDKLVMQSDEVIGLNDCYAITPSTAIAACEVWEKASGRVLRVFTSYPGLLIYTGDHLGSNAAGHLGRLYQPFDGFCLECQYYPDSPNHANFPSVVLDAGEQYNEFIKFSFGIK